MILLAVLAAIAFGVVDALEALSGYRIAVADGHRIDIVRTVAQLA